jgi:predicted RNase H-like HicB family nuclease
MKVLVVFEQTDTGYSAYAPDLPGCIATGSSREEAEQEMRSALEFHVEGMQESGEKIPEPRTFGAMLDIPA